MIKPIISYTNKLLFILFIIYSISFYVSVGLHKKDEIFYKDY